MVNVSLNEESIFNIACRIPADDARTEYLDQICGDDGDLRRRVQRLLDVYFQQPTFLENSHTELGLTCDVGAPERVGSTLGPYKILEKIAEGGMGVVYVAEQREPVRRKVALKVIRPGMAGKNVVARFEAERQALAMMNHPNIARVFDGGATDEQLPYFVMELVQGLPITDYCDQQRMNIRERLELFLDVCHAVQHAHQKGIIHRDLKPSNVLVGEIDDKAVAKVIDFGVAKAIHQPLTEHSIHTQFSQMIGTPLYMSPEQAGLGVIDVDTRSDVYSLGVMLYEMLTGDTPFSRQALETATFDEMRRIIREQEPRRPSAMISTMEAKVQTTIAEQRGIDSRKLRDSLQGELDWLVMKALEKDRVRRYESVSALASDIQRYLSNEPMEAGPPSTAYRVKKFAQRNRGPLLVGSLAAMVLLTGLLMASRWKWRQYQTQLQVTGDVEQSLTVAESAFTTGDLELADRKVAEAQNRIAYSSEHHPELSDRIDVMETRIRNHQADLKRYREFEKTVDQIWMSTYSEDESIGPVKDALGLYGTLDDEDWTTKLESSSLSSIQKESVKQSAYELLVLMAYDDRSNPNDMEYLEIAESFHIPTLAFYIARAQAFQRQKDSEKAAADRQRVKQATDPATAFDHFMAGQFASRAQKDPEQAIKHYEQALFQDPDHVRSLFFLAYRLSAVGRDAEAVRAYQACIAVKPDSALAWSNLGVIYTRLDNTDSALMASMRAVDIDPARAHSLSNLAYIYWQLGKLNEALRAMDRAIELDSSQSVHWRGRGVCHSTMGNLDLALQDLERAVELAPNDSSNYLDRGVVYTKQGKLDEAFEDFSKSIEIDAKNAKAFSNRGEIHRMLGRTTEAIDDLSRSIELFAESDADSKRERNLAIANAENSLAWILVTCADSTMRDPQRAVELATQANSRFPKPNPGVLNTLGIARFRVDDFVGATEALNKSEELGSGQSTGYNGLFLAMAHAKLGQKAESQQWYEKAAAWINAHDADVELQRFRAEADQLLESLDMLPPPSGERRTGQAGAEDTRADQPPTQPERSSEPVLEPAGADPS